MLLEVNFGIIKQMDKSFQGWLIGEMQKGHKHESIKEKMSCSQCGQRFMEVKRIYDKEIKKNPSLVERKHEFKRSEEYAEMATQLLERIKKDGLYKEHLRKSALGTPQERAKEAKKANSGYYTRHSDYRPQRMW